MTRGAPVAHEPGPSARLVALLLLAATLAAYAPVLRAGFVWNDDDYLTRPALASLNGLARIWTDPSSTEQYYPLLHTWFWLQNQLFGREPLPYHLVGVLLHAGVAVLLWRILARLAVPGALLAAFLFALHPLHVQSVAWVSEQKNTLSGLFGLGAVMAWYAFDASRGPSGRRSAALWALALALFVCALLSKTVTAGLPGAILVIAWWKEGRIDVRRTVVPLVPFALAALALGLATLWVEKHVGGAQALLTRPERVLLAGKAPWVYLGEVLWPVGLCFMHPRLDLDPTHAWSWVVAASVPAVLLGLWLLRDRVGRAPLSVLLVFGGLLAPVLGALDVYSFVYWHVADHFAYLASAAVLAGVAAAITTRGGAAARAAALAVPAVLAFLTFQHARDFRDAETLWRATIARNPAAFLAWTNLANLLNEEGRFEEARQAAVAALAVKPDDARARVNLATALQGLGRHADAVDELQRAVAEDPTDLAACTNLGNALQALGRHEQALDAYRAAIAIDPDHALVHVNLGNTLLALRRGEEALREYARALELDGRSLQAWYNLGVARGALADLAGAEAAYQRALEIDPGSLEARFNLAVLWLQQGRRDTARAGFEEVVRRDPDGSIGARAREVLRTRLRDG